MFSPPKRASKHEGLLLVITRVSLFLRMRRRLKFGFIYLGFGRGARLLLIAVASMAVESVPEI